MKNLQNYEAAKISLEKLYELYNVNSLDGLGQDDVFLKRKEFGANILKQAKKITALEIFLRQFKSLVVVLLILACVVSFYLENTLEAIAIFIVIVINSFIGFLTELKATRSMEALSKIGSSTDIVLRDQQLLKVNSDELVVSDIVILEAGDIVSADMRLISSSSLLVNESSFTGESLPVEKDHNAIVSKSNVSELKNMLFRASSVVSGSAKAIVVNVGMNTEIGKIAKLTFETEDEITPLEKKLNILGKRLIQIAFIMSVFVAISGIMSGRDITLMIEVAIALTIAAIPEGLPIVATLALAKGMLVMSRKNALINKLSAVETLGTTTTIFTDKTGTITENKMLVECFVANNFEYYNPNDHINDTLKKGLKVATLCNSASIENEQIGDTMEVALLHWSKKYKVDKQTLLKVNPLLKEYAFDFQLRMMATVHSGEKYFFAVKGAPEKLIESASKIQIYDKVIDFSKELKEKWIQINEQHSLSGSRMLALAFKEESDSSIDPYSKLIFLGLLDLKDPPVKGIENSIDLCHKASINVVMITGDHKGTAKSIAQKVHIAKADQIVISGDEFENFKINDQISQIDKCVVFARFNPKQKLELIDYYQRKGHVVAMTGDGVNDAPALKKADIGIAMGVRGTQVAKEVSDIILKDDQFSSIITAIFQGRVIYNNIRYFVIYLISCNVSEVLSVALASITNLPLPIRPFHILFLNLVTDVFPALALGLGKGDDHYMSQPPRKTYENIITSKLWIKIIVYGVLITLSVISSLVFSLVILEVDSKRAVTISFFTIAFAQLFHVFNVRDPHSNFFKNEITMNPFVWPAIFICTLLMFLTLINPYLKMVMNLEMLRFSQWIVVLIFSILPVFIIQIFLILYKIKKSQH